MSKKNVVIVGFGGMGNWHSHELEKSDVCNLLGIYDIKQERVDYAKSRGIYAYSSFEEVLADKCIDVILISTPNDQHKPLAIEAMNRGHNVITEKPVTLSSSDLSDMIAVSKKNHVLFTTHQNRRWDEDFLAIKQIYDAGKLGPVFNLESRVHGSHGIPGDWRNEKQYGGGMMLDWGVHLIDQLVNVMLPGKISTIYAKMDHVTNEEVDDGFRLVMQFECGVRAMVEVGTSNFIELPRWYMQGENGSAIMRDWSLSSGEIVCCENWEDKDVVPVRTAAGLTKTMAPRSEDTIRKHPFPDITSDVHDYYRNICATLDGKATQIVTHEQLMRVMHIMEAAFESDRLNQVISFNG